MVSLIAAARLIAGTEAAVVEWRQLKSASLNGAAAFGSREVGCCRCGESIPQIVRRRLWRRDSDQIAGSVGLVAPMLRPLANGGTRALGTDSSQLINPVVRLDFHLISSRGKELPPEAEEFTSFLKNYIAIWAGRAGVL
jgi:hypothetical protein